MIAAREPEAADKSRDVIGHRLEAHRPIGGRRAPMRLEVHPDDLTPCREELDVGPEHLDRPEATVQEDERLSLADDLVAELDPVDAGNIGGARRLRHIVLAVVVTPVDDRCRGSSWDRRSAWRPEDYRRSLEPRPS